MLDFFLKVGDECDIFFSKRWRFRGPLANEDEFTVNVNFKKKKEGVTLTKRVTWQLWYNPQLIKKLYARGLQ